MSISRMNISRWKRQLAKCAACKRWRDPAGHDRCIRRTAFAEYACCGHDDPYNCAGYFSVYRGVVRFASGISPFLLQASLGRFVRTGHVAPFMQQDSELAPSNTITPLGCRFSLPIRNAARRARP